MKKLLAMLTTITSLSSISPIILANASAEIPENKIINKEINYQQTNNLELKRNKRQNNSLSDNNTEIYWINSETNLRKETDVPAPITTMYTFASDNGARKKGDIYFGTTNGVYLRKSGTTTATKIDGIYEPIKIIQEYYHNGNIYNATLITSQGNIYYIGGENNETYWQLDVPCPVTTMYTFASDNGARKKGDIYFGTTNGIYLLKSDTTTATKIDGIDEPIKIIQEYNPKYDYDRGSVHVVTLNNNIYYINKNDVVFKQSDVPVPITTMYTFASDNGARKKGDIYFGTTNGIYLRKSGATTATKIDGIDEPIKIIQEYNPKYDYDRGSVHVVTLNNNIYYINKNDVVFKQSDVPAPITTMYTFASDNGARKKGDIYFGTTNGVYLRKSGATTATKIDGIDGQIMFIKKYFDNINSVHIISLISNKKLLQKRQVNNYKLVIDNSKEQGRPVISNILSNNFNYNDISDSQSNILVTSRGFNEYRQSLASITSDFYSANNNFIHNNNENFLTLNPQQGYFIVEVSFTESSSTNNRVELVFNRQNLYLAGFIIRNNNISNYYYFRPRPGDEAAQVREVNNVNNNINLGFGGDYTSLLGGMDLDISWESTMRAFEYLQNFDASMRHQRDLKQNLVRIILVTSELMRFGNAISLPIAQTTQFGTEISWNSKFHDLLNHWGTVSRLARSHELSPPSNSIYAVTNDNGTNDTWEMFLKVAHVYLMISSAERN